MKHGRMLAAGTGDRPVAPTNDRRVYALYGLTPEEIAIVEGQLWRRTAVRLYTAAEIAGRVVLQD